MNSVAVWLVVAALAVAQVLIGGTRQLYSIPACALISLAALSTVLAGTRIRCGARPVCLLTMLILCAYIIARDRFSPVEYLARPDLFIVLGSAMVYMLTALCIDAPRVRARMLFTLLALALLHAVIGAIQFKRNDQFMLLPWIHRTDTWWRASGFYISPNHYAGLLETTILLTLSLLLWARLRTLTRVLLGYGAACCLAGLILSGSRGGYLSFTAGTIVLGSLSLWTLKKVSPHCFARGLFMTLGAFAAAGIVGMFLILQSHLLTARVQEIHDPENMRWLLWSAAIDQFRLAPLLGTGSGTYLFYGRMFRNAAVQADPVYVHNDYLHLLAEYGAIGALLFLVFLVTHLATGIRNLRRITHSVVLERESHDDSVALQIGALSAICTYVIHSIFDFNMHIPANAFFMAFIFGIVCNPGRGEAVTTNTSVKKIAHFSLVASALGALIFGLPKLPGEFYAELARSSLRDRKLEDARHYAAKALDHEKRNPDIYYYAGEAARALAVAIHPTNAALGTEAVKMFQDGLTQFPQDVRIVYKLAQTFDDLRQFQLAEEQLQRASELDPSAAMLSVYYGIHYQAQGMLEEAEQHYERALELDPQNTIARAGFDEIEKLLKPVRDAMPTTVPDADAAATEIPAEPASPPGQKTR